MMPETVRITAGLTIPLTELDFRASRSGGPGGQHVNTSSTRIELWWDAVHSLSLSPEERDRLLRNLATRLTEDGRLRIVASASRSQARNREEALIRFGAIVRGALAVRKRRRPTRVPRGVKEQRLATKRKQSRRKQERRRVVEED
ncbi:MAG TPA: alternative ribosome rescue aminoacyl-tRNA hydrolase ArfB [Gemmatimonadales bacterium]|nr:alternative ribosome rescue aminoacyl-tRNA hydrolase ArfB [Gemmatimonadales bacterium]